MESGAISWASPQGGMGLAIGALLDTLRDAPDYAKLVEATTGSQPLVVGLSGSQKSLYVAALAAEPPGGRHFPALILTHSHYQAEKWHRDLSTLLSPERVLLFPNLETHPHEEVLSDPRVLKGRLAALLHLAAGDPVVVVASGPGCRDQAGAPRSICPLPPRGPAASERLDLDASGRAPCGRWVTSG